MSAWSSSLGHHTSLSNRMLGWVRTEKELRSSDLSATPTSGISGVECIFQWDPTHYTLLSKQVHTWKYHQLLDNDDTQTHTHSQKHSKRPLPIIL